MKIDRIAIVEQVEAFKTQVGGDHYKDLQLQPLQAVYLRYGLEGLKAAVHMSVDKYFRCKNSPIEDLEKAQHCLSILIEVMELESLQKWK